MANAILDRVTGLIDGFTIGRADDDDTRAIVRSTLLEEARDPFAARLTIRLAGLLVLCFVVWAMLTPLYELTTATGTILPEGFVQQVQHLEGGTVKRVMVDDDQKVKAGDPLVELDDLAIRAELTKAESKLASLDLTAERLAAFVEERDVGLKSDSDLTGIRGSQEAAGRTQSNLRDAQLAVVQAEIDARESEIEGLLSQIEVTREEQTLVTARAEDYRAAAKRGAISRREAEAVWRDKLKVDGDMLRLKGQLNGARAGLAEARSRQMEVRAQLSTDALERLTSVETDRAEAREQVAQLRDRLKRTTITAPVSGRIQAVAVRGPGAVVAPGEVVLQIVPDHEDVFAQVEIPAESIGYVEPGMPAVVKVTTYDFARFGGVDGVVDRVSPSNRVTEDGRQVFTARIKLDSDYVGPTAAGRVVRPGMTVVADIRTGEKSVLTFLLKPLRVLADGAMTER
ncbi:MAG: HlyD family type I secretion periplasmic adaptor subunit [Rhodobiaceae bacterium]|nr:HlyD family type I secretion periplasmic adaptor subunit [Rhodobiaceae bacterium]